jgi:3-dehydroquinate dehydratase II
MSAKEASAKRAGRSPAGRLIYVINGPNLFGAHQPGVHDQETMADLERDRRALAKTLDLAVAFYQSNLEGGVIDFIHDARAKATGVILNARSYAHTSIGIHDALKILDVPIIEVHMSNIHQREEFRHHSYISRVASGVILGCGAQGYQLALQRMARLLGNTRT